MALNIAPIRQVIAEVLEGSHGSLRPNPGTFRHGVFEGMDDAAKQSRLVQTGTVEHWFDVTCGAFRTHPASAIASSAPNAIKELPITITVWTHLPTEPQLDDRDAILANIASDCETACQALAYVGNLAQTEAAVATNIVSGVMRSVSNDRQPEWQVVEENWVKKWVKSQIIGNVIVTVEALDAFEEPEDPSDILGGDLIVWYRADAEVTTSGNAVTAWGNQQNADSITQGTAARQPTISANGFSDQACIEFDGANDQLTGTLTTPLAQDSRPYIWLVARCDSTVATSRAFLNFTDSITASGPDTILGIFAGLNADNTHFCAGASLSDGFEQIAGPERDTDHHLFEYGAQSSTVDKFVVDGVGFDGTLTGGLEIAMGIFEVGALSATGFDPLVDMDGAVAEIIVSDSIPTADQIARMRDYFRGRSYGLSIV